jgi:hypothetical protein
MGFRTSVYVPQSTGLYLPSDYGWAAWPWDPINTGVFATFGTAGQLYAVRCHLPVTTVITNVVMYVGTIGNTLTAGQCFAALFRGSGAGATLVGQTADQSVNWASTGLYTAALAGGPYTVPAGDIVIGWWFNGTTSPAFPQITGFNNALMNQTSGSNMRFFKANTGLTTTAPGSVGAETALATSYWAAVS